MGEFALQVIRGQVARYLAGEIDILALRGWLLPSLWEIERSGSQKAAELGRTVQLLVEEFAHGDWNEDELRGHLRGALGVVGDPSPIETLAGSASATTVVELVLSATPGFTAALRSAGTRHETVFS